MKNNRSMLATIFSVIVSGTVLCDLALANEDVSLHKQAFGTKVKDKFRLGQHTFFIPKGGEWMLAGANEYRASTTGSGQGPLMGQVLLLDVRDNRLVRGISARSTLEYAHVNDWLDEPCKRENTVHKIDAKRNFKDQYCVLVNHRVNILRETNGWLRPAGLWSTDNSISLPQTVMEINVTRYIPSQFMTVTYFFNPEVDGFKPSSQLGWRDNDWNKDRIKKDPGKVKYAQDLQLWAKSIMPFYEHIFDQRGPLGESFPAAPYPAESRNDK